MTLKQIRSLFVPGRVVTVTNHYITRPDHPCFGTRKRTVERTSGSHLYFTETGAVAWPRASAIRANSDIVHFFGGGIGQQANELFLTIRLGDEP